jgi:WD40 repeat protein
VGVSSRHNSDMVVSPLTGEVAFPAGCIVVIYSPSRNKQRAYMRSSRPVSSLAFSRDGRYLAVGEYRINSSQQSKHDHDAETQAKTRKAKTSTHQGDQDVSVSVWDMRTYQRVAELCGHRFGVAALCFSPDNRLLVSTGFQNDGTLRVWDWQATPSPSPSKQQQHGRESSTAQISSSVSECILPFKISSTKRW